MDNAAIDVERRRMWESMGKLEQMVHIAGTPGQRLEAKATELDGSDPVKAKILRENALFYARQRTPDLLTQMARSEEHPSHLQSLMRSSYAVFCLKKKRMQPSGTTKT